MQRVIRFFNTLICSHYWERQELVIERQHPYKDEVIDRDIRVHAKCTRCPAQHHYSKFGRVRGPFKRVRIFQR
ncbi:MAG: hypothetical protein CMI52_04255 [Parcubacteria group bacterium]|nr:hypothetical protein [Parcubacteria group bacterium]